MVEWLKEFVANFSIGDLFTILGAVFSTGIGLWALRIYKAYKVLKEKTIDEAVRIIVGENNQDLYDKLIEFFDNKLKEQDAKIEQVNTNLVLATVSKVSDSDKILAMIENSNLKADKKESVKETVAEVVKTEEEKKEENIRTLEAI